LNTSLSRTERGFALTGPGLDMNGLYHDREKRPRSGCPWTDRLQIAIDLSPALDQIVVHLEPEEKPFRDAEIACKPQIGIRGNIPLAEHNLVDAARGHVNRTRQGILAQVHRFEELFAQDFAGMRVAQQSALSRDSRRFRHASVLP